MTPIKQILEDQVARWEFLGVHALLERFVLRNGKEFSPRARIGRKRKAKECFKNATDFVINRTDAQYVEGFVVNSKIPFPIHHAWVTTTGDDVMDPTLDAEKNQYFGVTFTRKQLESETLTSGYYGLLDAGARGLNAELMFHLDPELEGIVKAIKPRTNADMLADLMTTDEIKARLNKEEKTECK